MWSLHWLGLWKPPLNEVCAGGGWHRSAASGGLDEFKSSYDRQFHSILWATWRRMIEGRRLKLFPWPVIPSMVVQWNDFLYFCFVSFYMHCRSIISHDMLFLWSNSYRNHYFSFSNHSQTRPRPIPITGRLSMEPEERSTKQPKKYRRG